MKVIEISRKFTIELTEKELLAIMYCIEQFLLDCERGSYDDEALKKINLTHNLLMILKQYVHGGYKEVKDE